MASSERQAIRDDGLSTSWPASAEDALDQHHTPGHPSGWMRIGS